MKYSVDFILSLKEFYLESPFHEEICIKRPVSNKFEKWNRVQIPFIKPIVRGENAWVANNTTDENEILIKKVKGVMNKLSKDNFDRLSEELYEIEINNKELVQEVINIIFKKAISEPCFGEIYASLCKKLSDKVYCNDINFKREILLHCQKEFEKEKIQVTDEEKKIINKINMLGNMKFLGELYKKDIITVAIIFECMRKLVSNIQNNIYKVDNIECICKLIVTTGKYIYKQNYSVTLDKYLKFLEEVSNDKSNDFRSRFMIKDLLDLKKNNWVKRK